MKFLSDILAKAGLVVDGVTQLNTVANATTDTDKFLVSDGGVVKYRTGAQIASDIGPGNISVSTVKHLVKLGVAASKGQAVYVSSADGTNMIVSKASNTAESTSSKTMGLLETGGVLNDQVYVITEGLLTGLDTSTAIAGDPVWLGTNGNLIFGLANKPYAPSHLVFIGIVTRAQQNNGEIFVKVQNGFELNEIHDVQITTTPADNSVLSYELSSSLFKMKSIATLLGYTPANTARNLTINGVTYDLSADRSWSVGTVTSVGLSAPTGFSVGSSPVTGSGTIALSFAAGYSLPTTASQSNWDTAYSNRITSLTTTGTSGAATLVSNILNIPNYTLAGLGGISGSGTINTLPKFSSSTGLTDSIIREVSGSRLLVGSGTVDDTTSTIQTNGQIKAVHLTLDGAVSNNTNLWIKSVTGYLGQIIYMNNSNMTFALRDNATYWDIYSYVTGNTGQKFIVYATGTVKLPGYTTNGFLKTSASDGTLVVDTNTYLTGNQSITLSGDATGSGTTSIAVTLANSGVTAGTYTKVTVDSKGRVTVGANLASADLPTYTGTLTSSQVTTALGYTPVSSLTDTLATVTARGASTSTQVTFSGSGDGSTTYSSVKFSGYNQGGGTGYHGFFEVVNTYGSATNGKKFFRIDSAGTIQIINSAYTANIFNLTDAGALTVGSIIKSGGTSSQILAADGSVITAGTGITISGGTISSTVTGGVTSFNTRTGAITLTSSDVTTALGYTPVSSLTDTLATVTGRGASTSTALSLNGGATIAGVTVSGDIAFSGTERKITVGQRNRLVFSYQTFGTVDSGSDRGGWMWNAYYDWTVPGYKFLNSNAQGAAILRITNTDLQFGVKAGPATSDSSFSWDSTYTVWHSGNLTNLNQLTNGPGYITGNQTITLSGDVTGSGATSISTTIASNAVTTAKINNGAVTAAKLATFGAGDTILWSANTDTGFIKFVSSGNAAGLSYIEIGTTDDGDEPIKFTQSGNLRVLIDTDGLLKNGSSQKYVYESGTWGISVSGNSATTSQTNFSSLTVNSNTVLHAGNYTTYAASSANFKHLGAGNNYDIDRTMKTSGGLAVYSGYSTGTNRPTTYDTTAQFSVNGSMGFEIAADWISASGPALYARSLRDCCQNWSSWTTIWTSLSLTNLNQLTNGPGYITGYTETDTLSSVLTRGNTSSLGATFGTAANALYTGPSGFVRINTNTNNPADGRNAQSTALLLTNYGSDLGVDGTVDIDFVTVDSNSVVGAYPHVRIGYTGAYNDGINSSPEYEARGYFRIATRGEGTSGVLADRLLIDHNGTLRLPNYSTNGFLKFSSSNGTVTVDTNTYLTSYTETDTLATVTGRGASTSSALTLNGTVTFTSSYSGSGGDYTGVSNPSFKIQPASGYWRIPHISNHASVSGVYNYETGKNVYWGEPSDTGGYYFRGKTLYSNDNAVWHAGNLTNLNQLTNGPGYITSSGSISGSAGSLSDDSGYIRTRAGGAEASLDTYVDNGVRSISFTGYSQHLLSWNVGGSTGTIQQLFYYNTPANGWRIRNKTDNSSWSSWGYVVMTTANQGHISGTIWHSGNLTNLNQLTNGPGYITSSSNISGNAASATQVVTIQDATPSGTNGQLWWQSSSGKLKVYYGSSSAWVDALPMPDMSIYYTKAGGAISGDVYISQLLTVGGNTNMTGNLIMGTAGTSSYIRMGKFPNSTSNAGEAWIGRASDRSSGIVTLQLGGSSNSSYLEIVDYAWTTVTLKVGMNDFSYKGNTIYHSGNIPTWNQNTTGNAATASNASQLGGYTLDGATSVGTRIFNNKGQGHSTYTNFNTVMTPGPNFLQGGTNGPTGTAGHQWYGFMLGLGSDYGTATGTSGNYASQLYYARAGQGGDQYLYARDMEGGTWGSWRKLYAGYADSAGSVAWTNVSGRPTALSSFSNDVGYITSSASISGNAASATYADRLQTGNNQWTWSQVAHTATNPNTITLWDQYSNYGGAGYPVTYGTIVDIYGRSGHEHDQILMDSGGAMYHRNCFYGTNTWNGWRTMLDSSNYNSYSPTLSGGGASGSWGITVNSFNTDRTNYKGTTDNAVAGQLMWKNYGNNHTIFDASNGTSPSGGGVNRWTPDYPVENNASSNSWGYNPVLMGWNGSNTYGVKVDWARFANSAVVMSDSAPTAADGKLWWQSNTGKLKVYYGSASAWVDAAPIPDMAIYYPKAGGNITGDVSIGQTLTVVGNALVQGNIRSFGDVTAFATSDRRLKDNITLIESPLEKISKISGVSFNWNDKQSVYQVGEKDYGVIAQEIEEVLPELVTTRDNGYKAVRYEKITPLLIEAIKEQQVEINDLKELVKQLLDKIKDI